MACYGCSINSKLREPRHTCNFTVALKKSPLIRDAGYLSERLRFVLAGTLNVFDTVIIRTGEIVKAKKTLRDERGPGHVTPAGRSVFYVLFPRDKADELVMRATNLRWSMLKRPFADP
jgi:hypothetical protein